MNKVLMNKVLDESGRNQCDIHKTCKKRNWSPKPCESEIVHGHNDPLRSLAIIIDDDDESDLNIYCSNYLYTQVRPFKNVPIAYVNSM